MLTRPFDDRRDLAIGETTEETLRFAAAHWIDAAKKSIHTHGRFSVALSGGSTPNAIYKLLSQSPKELDWSKVHLFWSDERAVSPTHPDSNYHAAMHSGLALLPIPPHQIFRMQAEKTPIEEAATAYEALIKTHLGPDLFDLVMLGIGEDGHTASLFPNTAALAIEDRLACANWVPQKKSWRLTLTYPCIRQSRAIALYALGASKEAIVPEVLLAPYDSPFPASRIGEPGKKALWILDSAAAKRLA